MHDSHTVHTLHFVYVVRQCHDGALFRNNHVLVLDVVVDVGAAAIGPQKYVCLWRDTFVPPFISLERILAESIRREGNFFEYGDQRRSCFVRRCLTLATLTAHNVRASAYDWHGHFWRRQDRGRSGAITNAWCCSDAGGGLSNVVLTCMRQSVFS